MLAAACCPTRATGPATVACTAALLLLAPFAASCRDAAGHRRVDIASIAPERIAAAVLDECHRPLRGRMGEVTASVTLPSGQLWKVFTALPDRARLQAEGQQWLVRGDTVVRLPTGTAATADDRQLALDVRLLVDACALGPLHRATACRAAADGTFLLRQQGGSEITLALQPGSLLPQQLRWPSGDRVDLLAYLHTGTTWVAQGARSERTGRCRVLLDSSAVGFPADFFELPPPDGAAPIEGATARTRIYAPGSVVETHSPTPMLVDGKVLQLWCVADPGDWPGRARAYEPMHRELQAQNQWIAGFPCLFEQDGQRWLAAPFRQRNDGREFAAPPGARIQTLAAGRWLVVYPPNGDLKSRIADGERQLHAALQELGLAPRGAITAQPYFRLEEGEPAADKLAEPTVRLSVAVQ